MDKVKIIIADIDNCIFDSRELEKEVPLIKTDRKGWDRFNTMYHLCKPNYFMIDYIKYLSQKYPIFFVTSRELSLVGHNTLNITLNQLDLAFNGFAPIQSPHKLLMRKYNDYNHSDVVKEEILTKMILPNYNPILAIDDSKKNCDMFRKYGIDTWHYTKYVNSYE